MTMDAADFRECRNCRLFDMAAAGCWDRIEIHNRGRPVVAPGEALAGTWCPAHAKRSAEDPQRVAVALFWSRLGVTLATDQVAPGSST